MKILVICSGGMSTSLLVKAMVKAAEGMNENITVDSGSVSGLINMIDKSDLIMVAPQVRHRLEEIRNMAEKYSKPVALIEPMLYGLVDGKGVLKQALELTGK
ncbi:MAG: PTS sugar transporter subunit IIB [Candidatus Eremiobacterota bacterium]